MARKALVDSTGVVQNIIEYNPEGNYEPPEGFTLLDAEGAEIGGGWDGAQFTAPPPAELSPAPEPPPSREEFAALADAVSMLTLASLGG